MQDGKTLNTNWEMMDEEAFLDGFVKEALALNPDLELDKEAFASLISAGRGALASARALGPSIAKNFKNFSPLVKRVGTEVAEKGVGALRQGGNAALEGAKYVGRGIANLPGRVAGYIGNTAKAQVGTAQAGSRVGGAFSTTDDLVNAILRQNKMDPRYADKVRKSVEWARKSGQSVGEIVVKDSDGTSRKVALDLVKDRLGNVVNNAGAQTVEGVVPTLRNLASPEAWRRGVSESFTPAESAMYGAIDLSKYNGPIARPLRSGYNFIREEATGIPLAANIGEYYMADSPEERREVMTRSIPASFAAAFVGNMAGKNRRMAVLPAMGAYMAADKALSKVPGLAAPRWGGYTQSQVDGLAAQYGVTPDQVKEYLTQKRA